MAYLCSTCWIDRTAGPVLGGPRAGTINSTCSVKTQAPPSLSLPPYEPTMAVLPSAEELDRCEGRKQRNSDRPDAKRHVADRQRNVRLDLVFKAVDPVFKARNIGFRCHALAQRLLQRLGMGARLSQ
jgi:hypothetical protein